MSIRLDLVPHDVVLVNMKYLDIKVLSAYGERVIRKGRPEHVRRCIETALEMEVERRREVARRSMRAARGIASVTGRVAGTLRFRHFLAAVATMAR